MSTIDGTVPGYAHERRFTMSDQEQFAALSGDRNPLHVDRLVARRLMYGRPLVHGLHQICWALDKVLEEPVGLTRIKAVFRSPLGIDEAATLLIKNKGDGALRIQIARGGAPCTVIDIETKSWAPGLEVAGGRPAVAECRDPTLADLALAQGAVTPQLDCELAQMLFPRLVDMLPADQIAGLLAATRIVGMECPGLRSIFSELDIHFGEASGTRSIAWRVAKFDARMARLDIEIQLPNGSGRLAAFVRPEPQPQPSFATLKVQVAPGMFAGQRALVLGGSRGLGEVCAKLLAAGGAELRLTYHYGDADANAVVADIRAGGGTASSVRFDVLAPPTDPAITLGGWSPTHLYYFATPPIFVGSRGRFSAELFSRFNDYYVTGFVAAIHWVRKITDGPLAVLYPSSEAVDRPPPDMAEYAASKTAGEATCRFLAAYDNDLTICIERFPRMPTDQTMTLLPVETVAPAPLLLAVLADMA